MMLVGTMMLDGIMGGIAERDAVHVMQAGDAGDAATGESCQLPQLLTAARAAGSSLRAQPTQYLCHPMAYIACQQRRLFKVAGFAGALICPAQRQAAPPQL
jgi:hypothetical protein